MLRTVVCIQCYIHNYAVDYVFNQIYINKRHGYVDEQCSALFRVYLYYQYQGVFVLLVLGCFCIISIRVYLYYQYQGIFLLLVLGCICIISIMVYLYYQYQGVFVLLVLGCICIISIRVYLYYQYYCVDVGMQLCTYMLYVFSSVVYINIVHMI